MLDGKVDIEELEVQFIVDVSKERADGACAADCEGVQVGCAMQWV